MKADPFVEGHTLTAETSRTMKMCIAPATRKNYVDCLTRLIRWFYDKQEDHYGVLADWFLERLEEATERDMSRRTQSGRPSKKREYFSAEVKNVLSNMSTDPSTHPIVFEELSFKVISSFLSTLKKSITSSRPSAVGDETVVVAETIKVRLTASSYDGVCSALSFLFSECDLEKDHCETSKALWKKIGVYKRGYRQESAAQRREAGLRTAKGKDPLPLACLIYLAGILHH